MADETEPTAKPRAKVPKGWDGPGTYRYTGTTVTEFPGPGQPVSVSPGQVFSFNEPVEGLPVEKVEG